MHHHLHYHRVDESQAHHHNGQPSQSRRITSHIYCDSIIHDRYSLFIQYNTRFINNNTTSKDHKEEEDVDDDITKKDNSHTSHPSSICSNINNIHQDYSTTVTKHSTKQQQALDHADVLRNITIILRNMYHRNSHIDPLNHTVDRAILYLKDRRRRPHLTILYLDDDGDDVDDDPTGQNYNQHNPFHHRHHWSFGLDRSSVIVLTWHVGQSSPRYPSNTEHHPPSLFDFYLTSGTYMVAQRQAITLSESLFVGEIIHKNDTCKSNVKDCHHHDHHHHHHHHHDHHYETEFLQNLYFCQKLKPIFSEGFNAFLTHNRWSMKYEPYVSEDLTHWSAVCGFEVPIANIGVLPTATITTISDQVSNSIDSYCNLLSIDGFDKWQIQSTSSSSAQSQLINTANYVCLEDFLSLLRLTTINTSSTSSSSSSLTSATYITSLGLQSLQMTHHHNHYHHHHTHTDPSIVDSTAMKEDSTVLSPSSSFDFMSFVSLFSVLRALPGSSLDHLTILTVHDGTSSYYYNNYNNSTNDNGSHSNDNSRSHCGHDNDNDCSVSTDNHCASNSTIITTDNICEDCNSNSDDGHSSHCDDELTSRMIDRCGCGVKEITQTM